MRSNQLSYPAIICFAGAKVGIKIETAKFFYDFFLF